MEKLLKVLKRDFPAITFIEGKTFYWSPKTRSVIYRPVDNIVGTWSLLHELAHALLEHTNFRYDIELLQLEIAAWEKALPLAKRYGHEIDNEHVQDCLDTYRDWLYQRSTCPNCTTCSLQVAPRQYACFNCGTAWQVSSSRLCRPYRKLATTKHGSTR